MADRHVTLLEAVEGKPRRLRAYAQRVGVPTANNRVYSRAVLEEAHRADKFPLIGYGQHDTDSLSEAVVNWIDCDIEDEWVMLEGVLLESAPGTQPLVESLQNGVRMGVSMRARGTCLLYTSPSPRD